MCSPCGDKVLCEDCEDMRSCDLYYAEKGFRLLEAQFEEDWKERREAQ